MENQPLVSVVMPTYNGEKYLQESLFSALNQDYPNMEILVLDDGSQDKTQEKLRRLKQEFDTRDQIRLILSEKNRGIPGNMNIGLKEAQGEYIAILDQDDARIDPNKTSKQIKFLEENDEYGIVGTNIIFNNNGEERKYLYPKSDSEIRDVVLFKCPMLHSSVIYRVSTARAIGGYCEQYRYAMDYRLFLDFLKITKGTNLSDITTLYRIHNNNTSLKYKKEQSKESFNIFWVHRNNFPNQSKAIILKTGYRIFNNIFGDSDIGKAVRKPLKKLFLPNCV